MSVTVGTTIIKAVFNGSTTNGPINVPGLKSGDVIIAGTYTGGTTVTPSDWSPFSSGYEKLISVDDEIQQASNLDWSSISFVLYLVRGI